MLNDDETLSKAATRFESMQTDAAPTQTDVDASGKIGKLNNGENAGSTVQSQTDSPIVSSDPAHSLSGHTIQKFC